MHTTIYTDVQRVCCTEGFWVYGFLLLLSVSSTFKVISRKRMQRTKLTVNTRAETEDHHCGGGGCWVNRSKCNIMDIFHISKFWNTQLNLGSFYTLHVNFFQRLDFWSIFRSFACKQGLHYMKFPKWYLSSWQNFHYPR